MNRLKPDNHKYTIQCSNPSMIHSKFLAGRESLPEREEGVRERVTAEIYRRLAGCEPDRPGALHEAHHHPQHQPHGYHHSGPHQSLSGQHCGF